MATVFQKSFGLRGPRIDFDFINGHRDKRSYDRSELYVFQRSSIESTELMRHTFSKARACLIVGDVDIGRERERERETELTTTSLEVRKSLQLSVYRSVLSEKVVG